MLVLCLLSGPEVAHLEPGAGDAEDGSACRQVPWGVSCDGLQLHLLKIPNGIQRIGSTTRPEASFLGVVVGSARRPPTGILASLAPLRQSASEHGVRHLGNSARPVGDKSIYTVTSLSLRFRAVVVFTAITAAFAGKMLAAVLLGKVIVQLHSQWTDVLSAVAFFFSALFIWFKEPEPIETERPEGAGWWRAIVACFASVFLVEWGDPGQIAVAALTVKCHSLLGTWLGGTLAMATKGGLAMAVGLKLRDRLPQETLRVLASASCCVLGLLALSGLVFR
jgi:putative Ca2+/H+ antiporter (TMEM165/GDT1 family)